MCACEILCMYSRLLVKIASFILWAEMIQNICQHFDKKMFRDGTHKPSISSLCFLFVVFVFHSYMTHHRKFIKHYCLSITVERNSDLVFHSKR